MTERPSAPDPGPRPGDTASLYSRAHLRRSRYWDFSASRTEVRGQLSHWIERRPAERSDPAQIEMAPSAPAAEPQPPPIAEGRPHPSPGAPPRWYALQSVLAPAEGPVSPPLASPSTSPGSLPPVLAVFSQAGGVGKTCLVATLGRALAALGEHVLITETAAGGLLPFYFGSRESRPGVVRIFTPPGVESGTPVRILSLKAERYSSEGAEHDPLLQALEREVRGVSRILVDIATASRQLANRLLVLRPACLIPILPDMSSVASVGALEAFLSRGALYVLNQFDASLPLHLDVREMLQQQLGDRLLPFVLRRCTAVSEALAEGMTVIDYAPDSEAAEDYRRLAHWVRTLAAPAAAGRGGPRWSEC